MDTNIFAARPMAAKTVQYCANDVLHLPDLHARYLGRIRGDWLTKAKEESSRRASESRSPAYQPHSPTKSLGPWGRGGPSVEEFYDMLEDMRMKATARDMFGGDDDDDFL